MTRTEMAKAEARARQEKKEKWKREEDEKYNRVCAEIEVIRSSALYEEVVQIEHEGNEMRAIKLNRACVPADNLLLTSWGEVIIGPCEYTRYDDPEKREAFSEWICTHIDPDDDDGLTYAAMKDGEWDQVWCAKAVIAYFENTRTEEERRFFDDHEIVQLDDDYYDLTGYANSNLNRKHAPADTET